MAGSFRTWSTARSEMERLRLFALHGTEMFGERIARSLGCHLAALEERSFEDGEHKVRPLETVAGCDVYVVHSLHGGPEESPNDKLCRLLFLVGALKDAGAARGTAGTPYLCYARKGRRAETQGGPVEDLPPERARLLDDPRIGDEFSKIAPYGVRFR